MFRSGGRCTLLAVGILSSLVFVLAAPTAGAQAGSIIDFEFDRTYSSPEVDGFIEPLFRGYSAPDARYGVDVYFVRYESTYPDGTDARVTAQLFVPRMPDDTERPLYVFGPGSTGIIDPCRPSREHIAGIHWGLYRAHALSFAGQGMVAVVPDYMGLGDDDRVQPFFQADAGAYLMLDAIRAAHGFLRDAGEPRPDRVFLAGYSQGGHAAFAAADFRERYAQEVRIDGIIGYGPTTDMYALLEEFVVVGPLVAYSFRNRYGPDRFDPEMILQDRWLSTLDVDVTRQCIGGIQDYYPWQPRSLYRESFADALSNGAVGRHYPEIDRILRKHSVGLSGHGVPALILQGTDDIVVYPDSQTEFVKKLRDAGSEVRYLVYDNERHDVRQAAYFDVLEWIRRQS
jgi:acetyl esterase/lipase